MASALPEFDELIDSMMSFVKEQFDFASHEGVNAFWDYLSLLQNRGFTMSSDFAAFSTRILEAMIEYQKAASYTSGIENKFIEITQFLLDFIGDSKGTGNWDDFLKQLSKKKIELTDEYIAYIKRVIEAIHTMYSSQIR